MSSVRVVVYIYYAELVVAYGHDLMFLEVVLLLIVHVGNFPFVLVVDFMARLSYIIRGWFSVVILSLSFCSCCHCYMFIFVCQLCMNYLLRTNYSLDVILWPMVVI